MKSILLTTTAIVAFAGAAAAGGHTSVTFGGDFTLGHNDDNDDDTAVVIGDNDGFYWEGDLNVSAAATLDNGITAGVDFEFDIVDETNGQVTVSDGVVLSLTSENAGIFLGDTSFAAEKQWKSAGDMEADGFSEADGENVFRADMMYGGVSASASVALSNNGGDLVGVDTAEDYTQLAFGASGAVGMVNFSVAYQEENEFVGYFTADVAGPPALGDNGDFSDNEIFGISAGTALAGADITVAYAQKTGVALDGDKTSMGVQVAYPFGPVTATVYYVAEDDDDVTDAEDNYGVTVAYADGPIAVKLDYDNDQGVSKVGLDGSYDVGNGISVLAGLYDESDSALGANDGTDFYVGGTYDLGGGAEILVIYADAEVAGNIADDEIGGGDYQVGTTIEVSFSF
jgi:outer membrane protein OmpU